jgi:hypothetical protein
LFKENQQRETIKQENHDGSQINIEILLYKRRVPMSFGKVIHEECEGDIVYQWIQSPENLRLISNWKYNRPPDPLRIREIQSYIESTGLCDGELLLAILPGEGCVCYDGIHRLIACQSIFPRYGVRVRILMKATEAIVQQEFLRINKGVPVPELYFSQEEISRKILHLVTESVSLLFSSVSSIGNHLSSSRKPHRPNMNRDIFVEILTEILKQSYEHEIMSGRITPEMVVSWLQDINVLIREIYLPEVPEADKRRDAKMFEKCETSGWYLWLFTDWIRVVKSSPRII